MSRKISSDTKQTYKAYGKSTYQTPSILFPVNEDVKTKILSFVLTLAKD
jgi:hypothetical protein